MTMSRYGRRRGDEPNSIIECACGCGARLEQFDREGRPRRMIKGHQFVNVSLHGIAAARIARARRPAPRPLIDPAD